MAGFEEEDAAVFFGRSAQIDEAIDRLTFYRQDGGCHVLSILGASGAGKSSFLRAGIWPRLRRDRASFFCLPILRPREWNGPSGGLDIEHALRLGTKSASAFYGPSMGHAGMPAEGDADGELLEQELLTLSRYLTRQMSSDPDAGLVTIVFAIDQAEELFRSDRDHAFQLQARRLTSIIARNRVPMIVIFSIRSDRFEKLQADPVLGNVRMDIFNLPPIPVNALREVIEGPARVAGLYIDPRLVERLLYDLGPDGVTDALPLLAFVLARLHQEASARSQIGLMDYQLDLMDYEELGGFRGAIELAIERALEQARVDPRAARRRDELERLLRLAFIPALVTIDPDTGLPRRRVTQLAQIPSEAHRSLSISFKSAC